MIEWFLEFFRNNQFASGGLALGAGTILYKHGAGLFWSVKDFIWKRLFITVRMDRFTYGFEWMRSWLGDSLESSGKLIHEYEIEAIVNSKNSSIELSQSDGRWLFKPDGFRVFINMHRIEEQTELGTRVYNKMTLTTGRWNRRRLVGMMAKIGEDYGRKRAGKIYTPNGDGTDWVVWCKLPYNKLSDVILDDGMQEALVADLDLFMRSEDRYLELGLSYKRGYLLHGPPGNGKTSMIRALANHLGKSIAFVRGSSLCITAVRQLIARAGSDKLIVIEDIDRSSAATDEKPDGLLGKESTLQDVLNLMDGVQGGNGQIIITTANHPERLDPAFLRPGRIDYQIELTNGSRAQARALFVRFHGEDGADAFVDGLDDGQFSMAELQQMVMEDWKL